MNSRRECRIVIYFLCRINSRSTCRSPERRFTSATPVTLRTFKPPPPRVAPRRCTGFTLRVGALDRETPACPRGVSSAYSAHAIPLHNIKPLKRWQITITIPVGLGRKAARLLRFWPPTPGPRPPPSLPRPMNSLAIPTCLPVATPAPTSSGRRCRPCGREPGNGHAAPSISPR